MFYRKEFYTTEKKLQQKKKSLETTLNGGFQIFLKQEKSKRKSYLDPQYIKWVKKD